MKTRIEKDSLGEKKVPAKAYYGIQTQRAVENFRISGMRPHPALVRSMVLIKLSAARVNSRLGALPKKKAGAIEKACMDAFSGKLNDQFVIDVFQAGAGTSFNMNVNEVLANRAIEYLRGKRGDYSIINPNDDVNKAQSTNDTVPAAIRLSILALLPELLESLDSLETALGIKANEFKGIVKSARTHLQDAVPIMLGREFRAYQGVVGKAGDHIKENAGYLKELNIGATAVGTGMNAHPRYQREMIRELRRLTRLDLKPARDLVEITQSMQDFVIFSNSMKTLAVELIKIANDLRLLSSGPNTGLCEITLPAVQPGSSIMPGKVNPVMAEMLDMVCFQVLGNDLALTLAAQAGQLDLNVMMPLIAYDALQSMSILTSSTKAFSERCVRGITANRKKCEQYAKSSVSIATVLSPKIGYLNTAGIAKEAVKTGRSIEDIVVERGILSRSEARKLLDPKKLS